MMESSIKRGQTKRALTVAVSAAIVAVLVGADQLTKYLIHISVAGREKIKFLGGTFQLTYVRNSGAAFSSFSGNTQLLGIFTAVIVAVLVGFLLFKKGLSKVVVASMLLIISGGIGNVIDRFRLGYVIDFIEPLFIDFAIFNFADCCITVGAFMLLGYEIWSGINDYRKSKSGEATDGGAS